MRGLLAKLGIGAKPKPQDVRSIVAAYGKVLETRKQVICDIRDLPYSKEDIKSALFGAMSVIPTGPVKEQFRHAYVSLGDFQDLAECRRTNQNPDTLAVAENVMLANELKALEAALEGRH